MPTKEELLASKRDIKQMCEYIKAKSLKFLSLNGTYKALIGEERNPLIILNLVIIILLEIILSNLPIISRIKSKTIISFKR